MKSPLMMIVCKVAWIVTSLAAINMGLVPFGYDLFSNPTFVEKCSQCIVPLHYFVGLCGVVSLLMLAGKIAMHGACGCSPRGCGKCGSMSGCNCK